MTLSLRTTLSFYDDQSICLFVVEFEARSVLCYMGILQGRKENWIKIPPPKQSHHAVRTNIDPVSNTTLTWPLSIGSMMLKKHYKLLFSQAALDDLSFIIKNSSTQARAFRSRLVALSAIQVHTVCHEIFACSSVCDFCDFSSGPQK